MNKKTPRLSSLTQPLLLGMLLFLAFTAISGLAQFHNPLVQRYMFEHPINRISGLMFFVGVAAIGFAVVNLLRQRRASTALESRMLTAADAADVTGQCENELAAEKQLAARLLKKLQANPPSEDSLLGHRLQSVFELIVRDGATDKLYGRFEQLAADDLDRQAQRYAFPRILIWAIPLLGFLGTVIGISEAMGQLDVGAESDLAQMMGGLQSNLNVAFDTTAQALVLSIALMFGVFVAERSETQLLFEVTRRVENVICAWFELGTSDSLTEIPGAVADHTQLANNFGLHLQAFSDSLSQQLRSMPGTVHGEWQNAARQVFEPLTGEISSLRQGLSDVVQAAQAAQKQNHNGVASTTRDELSASPEMARRIEGALLQLTSAVGELQRQLNLRRPEVVISAPTLPLERIATPHRKAA